MSKYSHLILIGIALFAVWAYGCENRRAGKWEAIAASLNHRNAQLEEQQGRVDTVYHDSVVVRTKVKRVTDSILKVDTLLRVDTVRQIVERERQACDAVIRSCEARVAVRDQRIAVLDSLVKVERKRRPGALSKLPWLVGGVLLGRAIR